jgi:hypothetical protein
MNKTKRILMIVTNVFEYKTAGLNRVGLYLSRCDGRSAMRVS